MTEDTTAQLREQIAEYVATRKYWPSRKDCNDLAAGLMPIVLAQVEAAKATAWYEGYSACASMPRITNPDPDTWPVRPANPYRAAAPVPATPEETTS